MLTMDGVSKRFGALEVLRSISLSVSAGEVVVVIGPSGSGKTTLLRCINMLEDYEQGLVAIDGEPIGYRMDADTGQRRRMSERDIAAAREHIGMVFQSYNLFPHMTVLHNITAAPIRVKGVPRGRAEERAHELLAMVGLSDKVAEYPVRLSGGQQQRVAIARALAMDPKIMLFDEVTSALDPELVAEVLEVIRGLAAGGMTMLIATHEMGFARDIANRVCFLDGGRILEQGPPAQIFAEPREARTRQFLNRIIEAGRL
jgi:polar amino acid transport system ATP-binding protein